MAHKNRKEFLTDLPENYDVYQERMQNGSQDGYQNAPQNGYGNEFQNGYQNAPQNGYGNEFHNGYQNAPQNGYGNEFQNGYQNAPQNGYRNEFQNGYQNAPQNGYGNEFQNGYQNAPQNGYQDVYPNENPYYFNNTGFSQEQWQAMSYPVSTEPLRQGLAIASMILGILSIVLCCIFGFILALPGLILGIISLVSKRDGTGMAIAGVITSALGIILGIFMIYIYIGVYKDSKAIYNNDLDRYNNTYKYNYSFTTDDFDQAFDF